MNKFRVKKVEYKLRTDYVIQKMGCHDIYDDTKYVFTDREADAIAQCKALEDEYQNSIPINTTIIYP